MSNMSRINYINKYKLNSVSVPLPFYYSHLLTDLVILNYDYATSFKKLLVSDFKN